MVCPPPWTQAQWAHYATGCFYSLELYVWHAKICSWLSDSTWCYRGRKGYETTEIWAQGAEWDIARQLWDILEVRFHSKLLHCLDNSYFSSWNTLHSFFLEQHPILQWLSPSWTILINILLQAHLTYHSQCPSVRLLLWASILSISTIWWLISHKYIELQWVRFQYYFLATLFWLTHLLVLCTSPSQAWLFQKSQVGQQVDWHG